MVLSFSCFSSKSPTMEVLKQSEWFWTLCSRVITAKWRSKEYGINKIYFKIVYLSFLQSFFPIHYNSLSVHLSIFITTIGSNLLAAERLRIVATACAKANKTDLFARKANKSICGWKQSFSAATSVLHSTLRACVLVTCLNLAWGVF